MVKYYQYKLLSIWANFEKKIVVFSEDSPWTRPLKLIEEEKPLVLVIYDESIFNANNRKKKV